MRTYYTALFIHTSSAWGGYDGFYPSLSYPEFSGTGLITPSRSDLDPPVRIEYLILFLALLIFCALDSGYKHGSIMTPMIIIQFAFGLFKNQIAS
jgi:hypothetical protein